MKFSRVRDFLRENAELSLGAAVLMLQIVLGHNLPKPLFTSDATAATHHPIKTASISTILIPEYTRPRSAALPAPLPFNPIAVAVPTRKPKPGRCLGAGRLQQQPTDGSGSVHRDLLAQSEIGVEMRRLSRVSEEQENRLLRGGHRRMSHQAPHEAPFVDLYPRNAGAPAGKRRSPVPHRITFRPTLGQHATGGRNRYSARRLQFLYNLQASSRRLPLDPISFDKP